MAAGATCILDTAFAQGEGFLSAWRSYADASAGTGPLHYVAIAQDGHWPSAEPPTTSSLPAQILARALRALCVAGPPAPGFYRLPFDQGRVLLTLCIGPRAASLMQLVMQADHIVVGTDKAWAASELRRLQALARRGTTLAWADASDMGKASPALDAALWKPRGDGVLVFDPSWALRSSRAAPNCAFEKPGDCTVIGAGISGAMVARALALRGWQVTVLERHSQAACGASGLPAGLVSASGEACADPLFALTRSAYHLTRQTLQSMLVQGEDWDEGGVMRAHAPGRRRGTGNTEHAAAKDNAAGPAFAGLRSPWRPEALWLKPQALIRACLSTPGVTLRCEAGVESLRYRGSQWKATAANGQELASSNLLVLCNAMDAARLLDQTRNAAAEALSPAADRALAQLHPRYGSISSGSAVNLPNRPALPVQGNGHLLPAVPGAQGLQWMAGAGFEAMDNATDAHCHQANLARVAQLVPGLAGPLQAQYEAGKLGLWRGQRCVSHDRLPLVGPATVGGENGLWMCLAMGARGLTFAALCAELLAARLMAEPLPLPHRLARLLNVQRLQGRKS